MRVLSMVTRWGFALLLAGAAIAVWVELVYQIREVIGW